jgi:D-3-phosphoglycerate dehydrogenase
MPDFKVYVVNPIHEKGMDLLRAHAEVVTWDDPNVGNWPEDADGLLIRYEPIPGADIARAKKLKAICKHGIGVEKFDLDAARARGIPVMNTPGANAEAVAELTMALSISVARRIAFSDRQLRTDGDTTRALFDGTSFEGKTVGIIGVGNIGRRIARKWQRGFDMAALGYDPYVTDEDWRERGVTKVEKLHDMLPQIDLLTIHCPLTDETRGMVGTNELALMKPSAIVVSTARGGIVDENALYDAIVSGRLYGAALDVFEVEPPPADHPLFSIPTFVATSHIGAGAAEALVNCAVQAAEQLLEVLQGQEARNNVAV